MLSGVSQVRMTLTSVVLEWLAAARFWGASGTTCALATDTAAKCNAKATMKLDFRMNLVTVLTMS